jgi:hypothetical protein
VKPSTTKEEAMLISNLLNNLSLSEYISTCMEEGEKFYMVEGKFWDAWCEYAQFTTNQGRQLRQEQLILNNKVLFEDYDKSNLLK